MLIEEKKYLEVTKEGFLATFYQNVGANMKMVEAHEKAVEHWEALGFKCRFQSYDGFRKNVLKKQRSGRP